MYVSQVIMASLPNIELVSFLIILTTLEFGAKAFLSVYIFVALEIFTYGLNIWVICYLYVWAILVLIILLLRKIDNRIIFALISGIFGLLFGTLCSIPYFVTGGIAGGISWILGGLWFDLLHCGSNFLLTFLLYNPLKSVLKKAL